MTSNQSVEAVVSYLKSQKIFIDFHEFQFQVESHPDFPNLLAFSDALHFFNIPNVAVKLNKEELDNLPDSFLTLLNDRHQVSYLQHITRNNSFYHYKQNDKVIKAPKEKFCNNWLNVVLLAEKADVENTNRKVKSSWTIPFLFGSIFFVLGLIYMFANSSLAVILGVLCILGIYLSVEALKTELGIESKVSQTFCNIVANADCGQVINSDQNTWFKSFKISNISIWFFCSQLFCLFLFSVLGNISNFIILLTAGIFLSVPLTLYSVYFQYKIEKKWCPICLSMIGLIYIQLIFLLLNYTTVVPNIKSISLFVFAFSFISVLVYLLKPVFLKKKEFEENYTKLFRFSRNYQLFRNNLVKSEIQFFEKEHIILGNPDAIHKISIVTSPLCGFCKEVHEILDEIMAIHSEKIAISIRFNYLNDFENNTKNLFLKLTEIYEEEGSVTFSKALKDWFEIKNIDEWISKYGTAANKEKIIKQLEEITQENLYNELNFTPNIFLNQYKFPDLYERKNLKYIVADWIDDTEVLVNNNA